jgi:SAM-dependent methyltransferase
MLLGAPRHKPSRFSETTSDRGCTDHYMAGEHLQRDARMRRIDRIERRVVSDVLRRLASGSTVADVPCGNGRMSQIVLEQDGLGLVALDLNPGMLASMSVRGNDRLLQRCACANVLELPLADQSVDMLINMRLLHHIEDRATRLGMLRELARVSRRWLITSFWTTHCWRYVRRRLLGKQIRGFPIAPRDFRELCDEAGLDILRLVPARRLYEEQVVAVCRTRAAKEPPA